MASSFPFSSSRVVRTTLTVAGAALLLGTIAAVPQEQVPGLTFRIRVSTQMPALGGGGVGAQQFILARASFVPGRGRIEIQSSNPPNPQFALGQYILVNTDSGTMVRVNPDDQTFAPMMMIGAGGRGGRAGGRGGAPGDTTGGVRRGGDGGATRGGDGGGGRGGDGGGRGGDGGGAAGGVFELIRMLSGATATDVNVTTDKVGAGEAIEGKATTHYRVTATFTLNLMGQTRPMKVVSEVWTTALPVKVMVPFDQGVPQMLGNSPLRQIFASLDTARRGVEGTPIKMVTTTSLPVAGGTPAGPAMDIVQTTLLYGFRDGDVPDADLQVPAGYTRAGRPGGQ